MSQPKRNLTDPHLDCAEHAKEPTGYIQWHHWAAEQNKAGLKQKYCEKCKRFRFSNVKKVTSMDDDDLPPCLPAKAILKGRIIMGGPDKNEATPLEKAADQYYQDRPDGFGDPREDFKAGYRHAIEKLRNNPAKDDPDNFANGALGFAAAWLEKESE